MKTKFSVVLCISSLALLTLIFQNCSPYTSIDFSSFYGGLELENPTEDDLIMNRVDKNLFSEALKYFPTSDDTERTEPRLFRLTRQQLQLTAQNLLSDNVTSSLLDIMPEDPLQTNYEFSEIINFNAANITPYSNWVDELAESVQNNPESIINCEIENNTAACLTEKSKSFIESAFRNAAPSDVVDRYVQLFLSLSNNDDLALAKSGLVDVVLHSPFYLFRTL